MGGKDIITAIALAFVLLAGCGNTKQVGDAGDAADDASEVVDTIDEPLEDVPPEVYDEEISDAVELPEACMPDGPELVGCPSSDGASHCLFSDSPVTLRGSGEPLVVQLFEDHISLIESGDDASWGYYAWTSYDDFFLDGTLRNRLGLGSERSRSALWTGTDFSVFPCSPGSLIRIGEDGDFLEEYELVGCYEWTAWMGTGYAAIGGTYDPHADFLSWISGDGHEVRVSEPSHFWYELPLEWTGCCFVGAYVDWEVVVEDRGVLMTYAAGWDLADWAEASAVDTSGLVVNGSLFRTPGGVAALWTESVDDLAPLELHARFLDKFGRPCSPPIFVDEIAYDLPSGPYYYTAFTGAWAEGRAIIAYLRYRDASLTVVLRSLLANGDLGPITVEYPLLDEEENALGIFGATGGSDMAAFWWNYHCVWDAPQCYDVKVYTCE